MATPRYIGQIPVRDIELIDENGVPYGIPHINNKPRVSCTDYLYDIAMGLVPSHSIFGGSGRREAIAVVATGSDIWDGTDTTIPVPVDAGEQLEIVSTAAADDGNPVGTGLATIHIHYLDAAGDAQTETVTLEGLTPVALNESNVRFVQTMHALTAGTGHAAAGTITLYKQGSAATIYSQINIGRTGATSTLRMVPRAKKAYLVGGVVTATDKSVEISMRMTATSGELVPGIFLPYTTRFLHDSTVAATILPIIVPALAMIKLTCYVPAGKAGADVSGQWYGWLENE